MLRICNSRAVFFAKLLTEFNGTGRAKFNTLAAGYALFLVYNSYTVYNMDRVKLTCLYTGTNTGTAVAAGTFMAIFGVGI